MGSSLKATLDLKGHMKVWMLVLKSQQVIMHLGCDGSMSINDKILLDSKKSRVTGINNPVGCTTCFMIMSAHCRSMHRHCSHVSQRLHQSMPVLHIACVHACTTHPIRLSLSVQPSGWKHFSHFLFSHSPSNGWGLTLYTRIKIRIGNWQNLWYGHY